MVQAGLNYEKTQNWMSNISLDCPFKLKKLRFRFSPNTVVKVLRLTSLWSGQYYHGPGDAAPQGQPGSGDTIYSVAQYSTLYRDS